MQTTRSLLRALALLAVPALVLGACGDDADGGAPAATSGATVAPSESTSAALTTATPTTTAAPVDLSTVTLRVGDQVNITQSALEAAGQGDTPYAIEWAAFPSGPPLLEALNADAIDIGGVGDAPPIFAASAGAPIKVVLATKTPQVNQGIIVQGDSGIAGVEGLRGKKIAVAKGSSANWILLKALQDNGLAISDVTINYLQPTDAQQAFANGSVDAWVIWDPFSSLVQSQGGRLIVTGADLGIPGLGFQVTSEKALADPGKEAAIRDFLRRLRVAQQWQRTNKDAWAATYSELTKLPLELAKQMLQVDSQPTLIDDAVVQAQQEEADAFFEAGLIPKAVDFSTVVDTRFNDIAAT